MFNPFQKDKAAQPQDTAQTAVDAAPTGEEAAAVETYDGGNEESAPTALVRRGPLARLGGWAGRHKKLCVVLVIAAAVAGVAAWRMNRAVTAMAETEYQYIRTTTLTKGSLNDSVTVSGTVVSGDEADVTVSDSVKTYKVATVEAEVGDTVQEGDVIATLDTTDLQKQIEDAQQSYNDTLQSAQTSYDRAVDDYNTSVVQHDNNLIDLQAKIEQADKSLADAEESLNDAKSSRDSAQSTRDNSQSTVDSLQSAYNAAQGIAGTVSAYDAAVDNLTAATNELNTAYNSYLTAYMNYQSATEKEAAKPALTASLESLQSAWNKYGSAVPDTAQNEQVSSANRRAVSVSSADCANVNTQLDAISYSEKKLQSPATGGAAQAFNDAVSQLITQETAATSGTGLSYQQVIDQYTAAKQALSAAETALTQAETAVKTAESQVETAEQQVKSAHDAYDNEKNYSTIKTKAQAVEDAETKLEQAKRIPDTLENLQDALADCTLTATMSGTITALDATVGSVCAGTVATIQDTDALVVEVTIPADDVPGLETGMACLITSDATGDTEINGTLTQIDPVANEQGSFGAKVRVTGEAADLLIGIQAQVEIIKSQVSDVYVVPMDAVGTAEDGSSYVLRKTGGEGVDMTFEEVTVTTGDSNDYYTTISGSDLQEGDVIRSSADLTQGIVTTSDPMEQMMNAMNGGGSMEVTMNGGAMAGDRPSDSGRGDAPGGMAGGM